MLVIVGGSGSGKSTLVKAFIDKHKDYKKIVTYTTRPMRKGEEAGKDYNFVSQGAFEEFAKRDFFVELNTYRGWYYGTALSDCQNTDKAIAVLTPAGMRSLKRAGVEITSVYLDVDRRSRLINILDRGDDVDEACRRSLSDVGQFDGLEQEADKVIYNPRFEMTVAQEVTVLEQILGISEVEKNGV